MSTVVHLDNIHKTYASGEVNVRAVRDVSLEINKGEFLAVMGASGSGKSTLMNLIGCLDRPTEGYYHLDGINIADLDRNKLANLRNQKLGFIFQGFNLLSRTTALENVELPMLYGPGKRNAKEMRDRAMQCLEIVGLTDRAGHFPSQLSGGQQQRVAIARALVNEPQILVADEPTGNLDSKTSIEILNVFQQLNDTGITILMVTHELDIAKFCRRNLVMRDGRIVSNEVVTQRSNANVEIQRILSAEAELTETP